MNKSIVQEKWQKLADKVKRPWGENRHSQNDKPVVGTSDTAPKKAESRRAEPQAKDSGDD